MSKHYRCDRCNTEFETEELYRVRVEGNGEQSKHHLCEDCGQQLDYWIGYTKKPFVIRTSEDRWLSVEADVIAILNAHPGDHPVRVHLSSLLGGHVLYLPNNRVTPDAALTMELNKVMGPLLVGKQDGSQSIIHDNKEK